MSIISSNHRLVKVNGTEYSAGSGIDITDNVISLDPSVSAAIDNKLDTSSFSTYSATIDEELQYVSANAGNTYSAGDNIDIYEQDNDLYISAKDWTTDIANASSYAFNEATAQIPPAFDPTYMSGQIDNKLNKSDFETYSGTVNTQITGLSGEVQSTSSILSAAVDYLSGNAGKTYSGIAPIVVNNDTNEISADTQDISFGVGLDFTGGVLSVTAQGGDPEVESVVRTNSADWGTITALSSTSSLLDYKITAVRNDLNTVSTNTGYLYNDIQTTSGILSAAIDYVSANATDISALKNTSGNWNDVYNTVLTASGGWGGTSLTGDAQGAVDEVYSNSALWSEITGVSSNYQPIGNYAAQTDLEQVSGDLKSDIDYVSANAITSLDGYATTSEVNTVSSYLSGQIDNKLDSTSFNPNDYYPMVGNPSGFISGVDLTDYQTKAGMTAYQPAGDYATTGDLYNTSSTLSGAIDYISGNAGTTYTGVAPIVVTGNTISADSFDLNIGSGLAFENDTLYVSAESVPEGVMVESACEYNAVNENSGYNGSAIAQYGAEKQWLVHDDTIVHVSNSAQYALGVNLSAVAAVMPQMISGDLAIDYNIGKITFAGWYDGKKPIWQRAYTAAFSLTTSYQMPTIISKSNKPWVGAARMWIDPSRSYINYGSDDVRLPTTWMLGENRWGSIAIVNGGDITHRGRDTGPTTLTARINVCWVSAVN